MTPPVLSLEPASLENVDTSSIDSLREMWTVFKGAKNFLKCGPRMEYISWRLYNREILAQKNDKNVRLSHLSADDLKTLFSDRELDISGASSPAQSELAANVYKSYGSSNAVRGFSPSHVSVAHRETPVSSESLSSSVRDRETSPIPERWHQARVGPRANMFFIDSGSDSDTESIQESYAPRDILQPERDDNEIEEVNLSDNDESGWDDTEEEENPEDEEQREEQRRRNLFKERAVPLKPLLKPSLLSNLFLNKQNIAAQRDEEAEKARLVAQRSQREDPSQVMLEAAVPGHIPISSQQRSSGEEELSQSLKDALRQSNERLWPIRPADRRQKSKYDDAVPGSDAIGAPVMSWTRPELSRSFTDPTRNKNSKEKNNRSQASPGAQSWINQHEDIYDPLNYHSRGW